MSVTPRGVTTLDANPQAARQVEGHFQERTMGERSGAFVDRIGGERVLTSREGRRYPETVRASNSRRDEEVRERVSACNVLGFHRRRRGSSDATAGAGLRVNYIREG